MKFNEKKTSSLYNVCFKIPRNEKPFDWNKETKEKKKMRLLSFLVNLQKIEVSKRHPAGYCDF